MLMLTHTDARIERHVEAHASALFEQSRGRPVAEGAKALSEALREGGAQDSAPRG